MIKLRNQATRNGHCGPWITLCRGYKLVSLELRPDWEFVADTVMGGVSTGQITKSKISELSVTRLTGQVSLENNGGFVQMAFDINNDGSIFDASKYEGIEIDVSGNEEEYDIRLRTSDLTRPWQSYRALFIAGPEWSTTRVRFSEFVPHKTGIPLDVRCLRRIGVLGIGREYYADVSVSGIRFFNSWD